jgi:hypothetical protein
VGEPFLYPLAASSPKEKTPKGDLRGCRTRSLCVCAKERRDGGYVGVINSNLDRTSGRDACVRMVANVAFFSQLRLGEILHPTRLYASFDASRQPSLSNISVAENGIDYCLTLPSTKAEPIRGETVTVPSHSGTIDPTHAIRAHRALNKIHGVTALASYMESGRRMLLTRQQ